MKKFLTLSLICLSTLFVSAQTTTPRYGLTAGKDNTGRILTWGATTVTPSSATVTIPAQSKYSNLVTVSSSTAITTVSAVVTGSYLDDRMDLKVLSAAADRTLTFVSGAFVGNIMATQSGTVLPIATGSTQVIPSGKSAIFKFTFDGAKWNEVGRSVQP